MDFPLLVRQRLKDLGTEQRNLAAATQVTESYISQLLTGKKPPPAPDRTDIYDKMESFLRLPAGTLATLADLQRTEALKRRLADPPDTPVQGSARVDSAQMRTRQGDNPSVRCSRRSPSAPSNASSPKSSWTSSSE